MIDFAPDPAVAELRDRVAEFVRDVAIPAEDSDDSDARARRRAARGAAGRRPRRPGVFAPHVAADLGGLGLDHRGQAVVFEEAGYSLLGPQALNCAAPDEGNMHLLDAVADARSSRPRYLRPLAAGDVRSCFAMTEPAPGAGSDPSMLRTAATRVDGGWSITGRKWFITGADGAAFTICMARTGETIDHGRARRCSWSTPTRPACASSGSSTPSTAASPAATPRWSSRTAASPDDAVLGEVGEGFRYAQVRLAPARLTHCMRWLGIARRALRLRA